MTSLNRTTRPVEFFKVHEPKPEGPIIGSYAGEPIASVVIDYFGRRYTYVGAAVRRRNGQYDVEALLPGEFLVEPGLVYYCQSDRTPGVLKKLLRLE
jgi:hypothetical protein